MSARKQTRIISVALATATPAIPAAAAPAPVSATVQTHQVIVAGPRADDDAVARARAALIEELGRMTLMQKMAAATNRVPPTRDKFAKPPINQGANGRTVRTCGVPGCGTLGRQSVGPVGGPGICSAGLGCGLNKF
jgi:hypothetical protein